VPPIGDTDADPFTRDREWNADVETAQRGDAVAVGRESIDLDVGHESTGARRAVEDPSAGTRSAEAVQLTFNSSTSKRSVAFGGMTPPAPCDP
jgi:hypothetical protein